MSIGNGTNFEFCDVWFRVQKLGALPSIDDDFLKIKQCDILQFCFILIANRKKRKANVK